MHGYLALVVLTLALFAFPAHADPVLHIEVLGSCPSEEDLRESIDQAVEFTKEPARWSLTIRALQGRAKLRIEDHKNNSVLLREVRSEECTALANAFTVIIHSYFVQLQELPHSANEPPSPRSPPETAIETAPETAAEKGAEKPTPVGGKPTANPTPAPTVPIKVKQPEANSLLWFAASLGTIAHEGRDVEGRTALRVGWAPRGKLGVQAVLSAETPSTQFFQDEQVRRQSARAQVQLIYNWRAALDIRGAIGGGIALSQVSAKSLPGAESQTRVHALLSGGLTFGLPLGDHWALVANVGADGFLMSDQYVIDPFGAIASSPNWSLTGGLGLEWHSGRNSRK